MTFEKFHLILTQEGLRPSQIQALWNTRPTDDLDDEERLRAAARHVKSQGF